MGPNFFTKIFLKKNNQIFFSNMFGVEIKIKIDDFFTWRTNFFGKLIYALLSSTNNMDGQVKVTFVQTKLYFLYYIVYRSKVWQWWINAQLLRSFSPKCLFLTLKKNFCTNFFPLFFISSLQVFLNEMKDGNRFMRRNSRNSILSFLSNFDLLT